MKVRIPGRHQDILRRGGEEVARIEGSNRVVLSGLDLVAALLAGRPPVKGLTFLAVGSGLAEWGANPPSPSLTARGLANEVYRQRLNPEEMVLDAARKVLRVRAVIPAKLELGTLQEFGVFGGDASELANTGLLFGYRRHAPLAKTAGAELERVIEYDLGAAGWLDSAVPVIADLLANRMPAPGIAFWAEGEGNPAWDTTPPAASRATAALVREISRQRLLPVRDLSYDPSTLTITARADLGYNQARGILRETGLFARDGKLLAYETFPAIDHRQPGELHRTLRIRLSGRTTVAVPKVIGAPLMEALSRLDDRKLVGDPVKEVEDAARAGQVIASIPAEGVEVPVASRVELQVGVTPMAETPAVVGLALQDAVAAIQAAGLKAGTAKEIETEILAGTVLDQRPVGGERLPVGAEVQLSVATAPLVEVPLVVGMHPDEAQGLLEKARLRLARGTFATEPSDRIPGLINAQVPVAGVRVLVDSEVTITLAVPFTVTVPNLVGKMVPDAATIVADAGRAALRALGKNDAIPGLALGRQIEQPSTLQAGSVLAQDPAAGANVALFSTVDVTVAVPAFVKMPDLINLLRADAEAKLAAVRLKVRSAVTRQSRAAEGTVLEQVPFPGVEVSVDTPVDLFVAGPVTVEVPALIGKSAAAAAEMLRARGLVLGNPIPGAGQGAEGTIVAQQPAAGLMVRLETVVTPTVIGMVAVPNVVGMLRDRAKALLADAALVAQFEMLASPNPVDTVIRQNPAAGGRVRFGSTVVATVAQGVAVPQIVGQLRPVGIQQLQAVGLVLAVSGSKPSEKTPDTILDQDPDAGFVVPLNSQVKVVLASGVAVPAVVGRALQDAQQAIAAAGLKPVAVTAGAQADDKVSALNPPANTLVGLGSQVQITTALEMLEVPDVRGQDAEEARAGLQRMGFQVKTTLKKSALPDGTVIAQTPAAKSRARPGTVVTLTVSVEIETRIPPNKRPQ